MKTVLLLGCVLALSATTALGVSKNRTSLSSAKQKMAEISLPKERHNIPMSKGTTTGLPAVFPKRVLGTYTGISGYFDFQCNAGSTQYIRVDPSNAAGNLIHIIMMEASDSTSPTGDSRGTYYGYSTDAGVSWNTFGLTRIPDRRSGYPSLDLLQGSTQGTVIANHNDAGSGVSSYVYIDSPPGGGGFAEIGTPPALGGGDEPIWPVVAGAADGSVILNASRSTANTDWRSRTADFVSWDQWTEVLPAASAGIPTKASSTGRVASILNTSFAADNGIYLLESTNNGLTWPATASLLFPQDRIAAPDTFEYTLGADIVYNGSTLYAVTAEINANLSVLTDSAQITFWSQATGFVVAASKRNTPGVAVAENKATLNAVTIDMPSIGLSGNTIVIAYQAMMAGDTSANGYNCNDIFLVTSTNGGSTWSTPRNLSNSRGLDDRFVSVSPWNPAGVVNLVWQEDTEAGGNIIADPGANVALTRQVFLRAPLTTGVEENASQPSTFTLDQNFPNPFNPTTTFSYSLQQAGRVQLRIYDVLGREVATVQDQVVPAGAHRVTFDASTLPSGVYSYRLQAGSYEQTRKMLLLK
jgi:hypothetical protein